MRLRELLAMTLLCLCMFALGIFIGTHMPSKDNSKSVIEYKTYQCETYADRTEKCTITGRG